MEAELAGAWTKGEARTWWELRAAACLEAVEDERGSLGSQAPSLEVDLDSRVASRAQAPAATGAADVTRTRL